MNLKKDIPSLGIGIGLRAPHCGYVIQNRPSVAWFEAISENYMPGRSGLHRRALSDLEKVRQHYPLALHGVSLAIGSTDPLNSHYLSDLKALIRRVEPGLVSDHLCWTGVD